MSHYGRIFSFISAFAFILLIACRVFLGGWINYLFIPLAFFLVSFFSAFIIDFSFYKEFLLQKTTKKGISMGLAILLGLVFVSSLNFLGVLKDKSWDISQNGLNTLSEGTQNILSQINDKVKFTTFYRGSQDQVSKLAAKQIFNDYKAKNSNIKSYFVNAYSERLKAEAELKNFTTKDEMTTLVSYKGRVMKVDSPLNEKNITAALVRATRKESKTIYFLTGHGEPSVNSQDSGGLSALKVALKSMALEVKELNFIMGQVEIPKDASAVALVGPRLKLFENEIFALKDYVNQGGGLFVAADPGINHDVGKLLAYFGVLFRNNFIIGEVAEKLGRSATSALGLNFDYNSSITGPLKSKSGLYSIFELASELNTVASDSESLYQHRPLVYTSPESFAIKKLEVEVKAGVREQKMVATEVLKKDDPSFGMVVFGDSDFLTNKDISLGVNLRLALNSFSYLVDESDLIQVPEKKRKGTVLIMTDQLQNTVVMAGFVLPMILLIFSGIFLYRRKKA